MSTRTRRTDGEWLVCPRPLADARVRLVCVPYAGGAASAYRLWPDHLPGWAELHAVQLPGREQRHREAPTVDMAEVVRAVATAALAIADRPLVFFGHSMGSIIACETVRLLWQEHGIAARKLIVSGRRPPGWPAGRPDVHGLPAERLIEQLRRLNGTPAEVLDNAELLEIVLPIVRADFALIERYALAGTMRLQCPVCAIGGDADPDVSAAMLEGWRATTRHGFETRLFPGDHFYINRNIEAVLAYIARHLLDDDV